jgi:hypothetical protein
MDHARWESPTRYYAARLYQDIFGIWVLSCARGGRRNNLGALTTKPVGTVEAGRLAIEAIDKVRKRRGYARVA